MIRMVKKVKIMEAKKSFKMNYGVISAILLIFGAFLIGRLSAQVEYLQGGGGVANNQAAAPTVAPDAVAAKPEISIDQLKGLFNGKNITFGDKNKKVIFVEFSDPSCPYCHVAGGKNPSLNKQMGAQFTMVADGGSYIPPVPEMKKLVDSGKAAFVWLYANGHGSGEMATKALYCAFEKGKFWQVHDLLMTQAGYDLVNTTVKNDKTKASELADFLKPAMSVNDMKKCLDGGKYDNRAAEDMALATSWGFQGTPNFYVNTTNFTGAYSFKDMQSAVDAALK